MTTTVAYLLALAALLLAIRVFHGFERQPVEKPSKRWVIVPRALKRREAAEAEPEIAAAVESEGRTRQHSLYELGRRRSRRPSVRRGAPRGVRPSAPNTPLAAYELALQEGADGVECDVRLTRDGHLVCVHDRKVDRTSTAPDWSAR